MLLGYTQYYKNQKLQSPSERFLYSDEISDYLEKIDFGCARLFYFKKETMTFSSFIKTHRGTHLSKC